MNFPSTSFHPLACQNRAPFPSPLDCYFDFWCLICFLWSIDLLGITSKTEALEIIIKIVIIVIMAQNQIIYVFLQSAQLGWAEIVSPCISTVKFSLVQFSFQLSLDLISTMRPIPSTWPRGDIDKILRLYCVRNEAIKMHFDKCRWCQGSPLTWAYTFQCMATLNQICLEQTGLQTGAETKRPSVFVKKMLSHKPCWDNRTDSWCLGRAQESDGCCIQTPETATEINQGNTTAVWRENANVFRNIEKNCHQPPVQVNTMGLRDAGLGQAE